jgi:myosin heavy subunit
VLGQQPGLVNSNGRRWDAGREEWVSAAGIDRKSLVGAHFAIAHFGATVAYNAEGFTDKNADPFDTELQRLMSGESMPTADGKPEPAAGAGGGLAATRAARFTRSLFEVAPSTHRSLSFKFRDEMATLVETLHACEPPMAHR